MRTLNRLLLSLALPTLLVAGCKDSGNTSNTDGGAGGDLATSPDLASPAAPAPPALGALIDRAGRPGANALLNHPFDGDAAGRGAAKDSWNAASNPTTWASTFGGEVAKNLAIWDALDTNCGNQLLAKPAQGGDVPADRYSVLGNAIAADRLWVNTAGATCMVYLAVELDFSGVLQNMDCGGRRLDYDVIDQQYSLFAVGVPQGVTDGIDPDADTRSTTFPFLAAPH